MFNAGNGEYTRWNEKQCQRRLSPCSTFKIFNSMAALDAGAIKDENDTIRWDGEKKYFPDWERDHNLRSAIKFSVVWFYQELAKRIGEEKMAAFLKAAAYGNQDMSGGLTKFWLVSSLAVNAEEQVEFLRKMYAYDLPFTRRAVDITKGIMIQEKTPEYTFRGKTGSGSYEDGKHQGWFVGWVERDHNVYVFAVNILDKKNADGQRAKECARKILKAHGLID